MSKKKMKTKTIVALLTMAIGLFVPLPMKALHDSDLGTRAGLLNHGPDAIWGGFTHQSFGNSVEGGFMHQSFGNSVGGGFTHQSFGNGMEGGFTHQTFGNDVEGGFTHQPFGNDAPLGGGLLILLSAGAGYAALKRTRQNNKQQ